MTKDLTIKQYGAMEKNVGFVDRLVRFVAVDMLLGISYLGADVEPVLLSSIAFILCAIIAVPIISGYSVVYELLNISTKNVAAFDKNETVED